MKELTTIRGRPRLEVPALIARSGDQAARRFVEFFTVNIKHDRANGVSCLSTFIPPALAAR